MTKAAFLDRDGVINKKPPEGDYVTCWEDFQLLPGVVESIAQLNRAGVRVIVVTNQRCIAKGLITTAEVEMLHQRMLEVMAAAGATIDAVYYCPHETVPVCRCRKPAPGMLIDAARDLGIELPSSWMIGDSHIDVEAGKNAGCKTARLLPENQNGEPENVGPSASNDADIVAVSLLDAVRQILHCENAASSITPVQPRHCVSLEPSR